MLGPKTCSAHMQGAGRERAIALALTADASLVDSSVYLCPQGQAKPFSKACRSTAMLESADYLQPSGCKKLHATFIVTLVSPLRASQP